MSDTEFGIASANRENRKSIKNYDDTENLIFSANLFHTIESLLDDENRRVKLASAIAIFIILRAFKRPMVEQIQTCKDKVKNCLY